jgi:hypothetical protein
MTWFRLQRTGEPSQAEVGKPTTWTITAASMIRKDAVITVGSRRQARQGLRA